MKQLILVRHAKSSWADDRLSDRERPLSARGRQQLAPLARALAAHGAFDGEVYASTANRARQTLAGVLPDQFPESRVHCLPELYTFDSRRLREWLQARDEPTRSVTLIGHNPALLELGQWLLRPGPAELPTAAFMVIDLPDKPWARLKAGKATLRQYLTPREFSYRQFARKHPPRAKTEALRPGEGMAHALNYQLQQLRALERGVVVGLDPEFLHHYRIALRRSRAMTEALADVTGDRSLSDASAQLRRHARATSRLRDLHVFEQELPSLCAGSPELQATLTAWVDEQIASAQKKLVRKLTGKRYQDWLTGWADTLHSRRFQKRIEALTTDDIRTSVTRRMRAFNRRNAELLHNAPDAALHRLRKRLKRIRYLMELDGRRWRLPLKSVRERQDLYGRFQDLHLQMALLDEARNGAASTASEACAAVLAKLQQDKSALRRRILALGNLDGTPA